MKGRSGIELCQTTGFVDGLLRLVGLDCKVPDFRMLFRRRKTLAISIPGRGFKGPRLMARDFDPQVAEIKTRIAALTG